MDIRHISYFIEVAKQGSYTRAGERLHLSQSSLTKAIQALEEEWNVRLFDRSTRWVRLTKTGEMFLKQCMQVMESVEELNEISGNLTFLRKGFLRMGLPPVVGSSFFPSIIAKFLKLYPGIEIEIVESGSKEIELQVIEGTLAIGIAVLPVDEERLEMFRLVDRTLFLVVHPEHRLAGRKQVSMEQLRGESFLLFRRGFALYNRVYDACLDAGFTPRITIESSQWDYLSESVAANLGITFLPETICAKLEPGKHVIIRDISPSIPWQLGLIRNKQQVVSRAEQAWIDFVCTSFED